MNKCIGFIGLGKLGLPVALAVEKQGYEVKGYDISEDVKKIIDTKILPYKETYAQEYLEESSLKFTDIKEIVKDCEIIFVPIQTPHEPLFEGSTRLSEERGDFDYSWLKKGIETLSTEIELQKKDRVVVIISTVLPGTIRKEIKPLLGKHTKLCYNPFFIAMGSTIRDFLHPEMILLGLDNPWATKTVKEFYNTLLPEPKIYETNIENAELIKVVYNTFIGTKIAFANTVMELCHHTPNTDVDVVTDALKVCYERIISDRYLSGGMGDGGGCHPRDNIALSWLSNKLDMSFNWFDSIMMQREKQTEWLADLIEEHNLPITILGKSFKTETNIVTGSPSILLKNILEERGHEVYMWDPYVDEEDYWDYEKAYEPQVYFIGTKHSAFQNFPFTKGSVIIDPWRYVKADNSCNLIRIGEA
jgi:UDPglucose 6-dehydrogenase